jgi:hypothetical protein
LVKALLGDPGRQRAGPPRVRRRQELIERLAAAYRAGELPDHMREFVDSLRTRPANAT